MAEDREIVCHTVGELIAELQKLPPETVPMGIEPPFDGVKLLIQGSHGVLICRPRKPEKLAPRGQHIKAVS